MALDISVERNFFVNATETSSFKIKHRYSFISNFRDRMQYRYRHGRDQRVQDVLKELNFTIKSDALQICGSNIKCLRDRGDILNNHNNSGQTALMYITIILVIYGLGLVVLLLHFVKQKYGQVSKKVAHLQKEIPFKRLTKRSTSVQKKEEATILSLLGGSHPFQFQARVTKKVILF